MNYKNYEDAIEYLNEQEKTSIDYCKIGSGSKNLIVSFSCAYVNWYERKSSILQLKYDRNDFDVLYLKSPGTWYLGGIRGVGKNVNNTISFLKSEFSKYEKVICIGISAGGYASILYGSLLKAHYVIATRPQTDLDYTISNCSPVLTTALCSSPELYQASIGLHKSITYEVFQKYKNLKTIINPFTTILYRW